MIGYQKCSLGNRNKVAYHTGILKVYNKIIDVVFIYEIRETSHDMEILSAFVALCGEIHQSPVDSQRASNAEI